MADQEFKYYAFISYSGKDEKWAKWLHTNLENYHIPAALCKNNPNLPKRIRPVFWYKKDLSGTKLKEALEKELESSRYLIVICSPDSAKSEWVSDEVQFFIDKGKCKYIIPFIVDGVPHSVDENKECFPESLRNLSREDEIRGISVQAEGRQHALVDVVATMFGVSFDILWQRHKRRRRKFHNLGIAIVVLFLLLAIGIYDYTRVKVEYYADYVDCWGIPEGCKFVVKSERKYREHCYKFEYERTPWGENGFYRWRVVRVLNVNSADLPTTAGLHVIEEFPKYPIMNIEYKDGSVSSVIYKDVKYRPLFKYDFSKYNDIVSCNVNVTRAEKQGESVYISSLIRTSPTSLYFDANPKIKRYTYERNLLGYITSVNFHANNDNDPDISKTLNENKCYGYKVELDSSGRIIGVVFLGKDNSFVCGKDGVGRVEYRYDDDGNVIYRGTYNDKNELVRCSSRYAYYTAEYDAHGNCTKKMFFNKDSVLCTTSDGYAILCNGFDSHGNMIERAFYGWNKKPYYAGNYRVHKLLLKYDEKCRRIELFSLGKDDSLCLNKYGYCSSKRKYDTEGNILEETYYDTKGTPCLRNGKIFKVSLKYINGNIIEEAYTDTIGQPCLHEDGYSSYTAEYDNENRKTIVSTWGVDGKLTLRDDGYAIRRIKYNDIGNVIEESFYDNYDLPCLHKNKYHKIRISKDESGNVIKEEYFDTKGKRCLNKYKLSVWNAEYNSTGFKIKEFYLDTHLQPTNNLYGIARKEFQLDELGNIILTTDYDSDGNVIDNASNDIFKILLKLFE